MSVILSPRGNEVSNMMKRFVRYEEAAHYFGIDETLIVAYAKAAGAVYQLSLKDQIIDSLQNKKPLPEFKTEDKLGDYSKSYPDFDTETDIKTKVLFLDGNPKAYNIDKLLEFLATKKSVYMIYLLGVDDKGNIVARLCSAFDHRLIDGTNVQHHWAGRNTRGVTQFVGNALKEILADNSGTIIDNKKAEAFIEELINK